MLLYRTSMTEKYELKNTIKKERDRDLPEMISREQLLPRTKPRNRAADEHFIPVKLCERACEIEACPLLFAIFLLP